ncbi:hypothetical protein ACFP81_10570 [Deinococcus lacus]|uniref:Uncharacterized protein n=1 Tax=Deinococcus lacus TaxID=392561 RepID=A0ABW1YDK6_9DEIO
MVFTNPMSLAFFAIARIWTMDMVFDLGDEMQKVIRSLFAVLALGGSVYVTCGNTASAYVTGCELAARGC